MAVVRTIPVEIQLRRPDKIMRLDRMGRFHQSRLSFMRTLLRRMRRENWRFGRPAWEIDAKGVGYAVYSAHGPERTYSLVAFAHDLDPALRSDRVIAEAWDTTFTLFDGEPGQADIERLSRNVPKQEAGRVSETELSLSRANKSVRLFAHVVNSLAAGRQPDRRQVEDVGYLMRTTAVYGSGKFGVADREKLQDRAELSGPFCAEMLSVYLIRAFTVDLAEHLARSKAPDAAVGLNPVLRRRFGVGNATGLGMAPFLMTHPTLINNWIAARETALARVRGVRRATQRESDRFRTMLARAVRNAAEWTVESPRQNDRVIELRADLARAQAHLSDGALQADWPWDALFRWAETSVGIECQEQLASLMMEPYAELVDELADRMSADEDACFRIDGGMRLKRLAQIAQDIYGWALEIDYGAPENQARFWYVSEEKLEPRLGERFEEPGAEYEQPLAVGRDASAMMRDAADWDEGTTVAAFLLAHPEHRHIVRRMQIAATHPYAEIRDNLIAADMAPIDLLRCKLSFFGATKFDPRSDRWVRITMFQDAPFPHELADAPEDDWAYPPLAS